MLSEEFVVQRCNEDKRIGVVLKECELSGYIVTLEEVHLLYATKLSTQKFPIKI